MRAKQLIQGPWAEIRSFKVKVVTISPAPTPVAPALATKSIAEQLVVLWGFDAATQTWQIYDPKSRPMITLPGFVEGPGYWLLVNAATELTFGSKTWRLHRGWNLIGW